jgi:hypothetical protein
MVRAEIARVDAEEAPKPWEPSVDPHAKECFICGVDVADSVARYGPWPLCVEHRDGFLDYEEDCERDRKAGGIK